MDTEFDSNPDNSNYGEENLPRVLTVREMNPEDQPRERALAYGCGVLSVPDLWAIVLRTGLKGKPITELCRDLMAANDRSLHRLERRTRREITDIKGIGTTKAIQIEAVLELIRRYNREDLGDTVVITSASVVCDYMQGYNANLDHEEIWAIYCNRRNAVVHTERLSSGSAVESVFDVKRLVKTGLLENAESIVLCHNHPSGNLRPSPQDDSITKAAAEACKLMEIKLLDHVIVSGSKYYSYSEEGRL